MPKQMFPKSACTSTFWQPPTRRLWCRSVLGSSLLKKASTKRNLVTRTQAINSSSTPYPKSMPTSELMWKVDYGNCKPESVNSKTKLHFKTPTSLIPSGLEILPMHLLESILFKLAQQAMSLFWIAWIFWSPELRMKLAGLVVSISPPSTMSWIL